MVRGNDVPALFEDALDYQHDLNALEVAQATFNEEGIYQAAERLAISWRRTCSHAPRLLDLCCATGLFSHRLHAIIDAESISLVDTDQDALYRAAARYSGTTPTVHAHCVDAALFSSATRFDLILMNSAYHHIEDHRKALFLANARGLLAPGGRIIVGDHFLPAYADRESFRSSVISFYSALLHALRAGGAPETALRTIRCVGLYTYKREYEYKVSWRVFAADLALAGLGIEHAVPVWSPFAPQPDYVGTMALVLVSQSSAQSVATEQSVRG